MSNYGYCPICGAPGKSRERRPDGNDVCERGHSYPAKNSLAFKPCFVVMALDKIVTIKDTRNNKEVKTPLIYRDDMVGVMPVYSDYDAAVKLATQSNCQIVAVCINPTETKNSE